MRRQKYGSANLKYVKVEREGSERAATRNATKRQRERERERERVEGGGREEEGEMLSEASRIFNSDVILHG